MQNIGGDITGIVTLLIGVAFAALLIGHASQTVQVVQGSGNTLNTLLNTVELTGQSSNFNLNMTPGI